MKKNLILPLSLFVLLFLYLLLFPQAALTDARRGLLLWYRSIIPVLFPFMLLCGIMVRMQLAREFAALLYAPLRLLFGCSRPGAFAVFTGFLCGFPMGAKVTADLASQGQITRQEQRFLCSFANNLSPAFLLSYLASDQLGNQALGPVFLANILGASALYGFLRSLTIRRGAAHLGHGVNSGQRNAAVHPSVRVPFSFSLLDDCIADAAESTVRLGAYIVIFSVLSGAAAQLLSASADHPVSLALLACIEVTNGISLLAAAPLRWPAKYLLLNALCSFGGLCALAQTAGIAHMDRRLFADYIKSRVAITLLCVFLSLVTLVTGHFLSL